ncbi:hypothetical protein [Microbacterium sp. cf332]|uniref:hypothetical protein n=1 Tax=Microbacterium sp. cf332 TaxID=1761804 RepID=UPI00088B8454|nr:hypothetical protein [Microbacterium sp. cf332]SDQ88545.1 hypothetical protein SAMN04487847_2869 [Microbacterium sp. cf332]
MRNPAAAEDVQRLRAQMERMQGRRLDAPVLPTHPALAGLLPGRGLRPGAAYSLGSSSSLLFALLAQPSQTGSWCGVIGMPGFGAEAAEHAGVDLSRVVLIPDPGARWLAVTATIADVLPVVAVRPPERAKDSDIAKLAGRLRDRGTVLLVQGPWPQTEAMLDVADPRWSGLGDGDGYLSDRELTVTVSSRRFPVPRSARMLLPAPDGAISAAPHERAFAGTPVAEPIPMRRAV